MNLLHLLPKQKQKEKKQRKIPKRKKKKNSHTPTVLYLRGRELTTGLTLGPALRIFARTLRAHPGVSATGRRFSLLHLRVRLAHVVLVPQPVQHHRVALAAVSCGERTHVQIRFSVGMVG